VYVPNKETELLLETFLDDLDKDSTILDVGTGSGCLAISVAKEILGIQVSACDIDNRALEVALENSNIHGVDIDFFVSNYVDDLRIDEPTHIIADLPWGDESYVLGSNDLREMECMPSHAIFHPEGILEAYRELITSIQGKKWGPRLYFESGKIEEEKVEKIIPQGKDWEYVEFDDYSVSIVDLA